MEEEVERTTAQMTVAAGEGNSSRLNPSGFKADPWGKYDTALFAKQIARGRERARARARAPVEADQVTAAAGEGNSSRLNPSESEADPLDDQEVAAVFAQELGKARARPRPHVLGATVQVTFAAAAAAGEGNSSRLNPSGEIARARARARAIASIEDLPEEEPDVDLREDPDTQAYVARALADGCKVISWSATTLVVKQQTKGGDRPRKLPPWLLYRMAHKPETMK